MSDNKTLLKHAYDDLSTVAVPQATSEVEFQLKETKAQKLAKRLRANLIRRKQAISKNENEVNGSVNENK
ncbi:MAG: hypothetical protein LW825_00065 [Candidatus Jidaibacter sp.]|jgi:hypothetical protein|nr:hypothetical protein [Candidatus Jidaibacter sp.]